MEQRRALQDRSAPFDILPVSIQDMHRSIPPDKRSPGCEGQRDGLPTGVLNAELPKNLRILSYRDWGVESCVRRAVIAITALFAVVIDHEPMFVASADAPGGKTWEN
jgi:hypothetical protein